MAKRQPKWVETEFNSYQRDVDRKKKKDEFSLSKRINKMSMPELVKSMVNGKINFSDISKCLYMAKKEIKDSLSQINQSLSSKGRFDRFKDSYKRILIEVSQKSSNFLEDTDNVKSISSIAEYESEIIRPLSEWSPRRNNPKLQLGDLLRHLYCKYNVPRFLDAGFVKGDMEMIELFIHIANGRSLKSFPLVPSLKMNNKVYHFLLNSPDDVNYFQSFRRAQILSMGADNSTCEALMSSKLSDRSTEKNDDFWITVINFFIAHPMVAKEKISEVIDYINNQKYDTTRIFDNDRRIYITQPPQQPNLSMKGRTIDTLIRLSDEWHHLTAQHTKRSKDPLTWDPININDLTIKMSHGVYLVKQLTSKSELMDEGRIMHHCVSSYASSCAEKKCSIFSLRQVYKIKKTENDVEIEIPVDERMGTIEVRSNQVVQVKAKYNKAVDKFGWSIINRWMIDENLDISRYVV